jgi:Mce-associated membrane protein
MSANLPSQPPVLEQAPPARGAIWLPITLAGCLVVALLACAALGYRAHAASQLDGARSAGLEAARSAAPVFMAYDHHHLDRDFARAKKLLTGEFQKEYADTTTHVVKPSATKTRAVVVAEVRAASVVSATPDRVVALLFVNQTTTSNRAREPRTDLSRVVMTVDRTNGRWLVSKLDAL